jgi:hypothetical protein
MNSEKPTLTCMSPRTRTKEKPLNHQLINSIIFQLSHLSSNFHSRKSFIQETITKPCKSSLNMYVFQQNFQETNLIRQPLKVKKWNKPSTFLNIIKRNLDNTSPWKPFKTWKNSWTRIQKTKLTRIIYFLWVSVDTS